ALLPYTPLFRSVVATDLGTSLDDFQQVLAKMDGMLEAFGVSLEDFAGWIRDIDALTGPVCRAGDLDELLERIERIVATVDWALTPVTWARVASSRALGAAGGLAARIGGPVIARGR